MKQVSACEVTEMGWKAGLVAGSACLGLFAYVTAVARQLLFEDCSSEQESVALSV